MSTLSRPTMEPNLKNRMRRTGAVLAATVLLGALILALPLPNYYSGILVYGTVLALLGLSVNLTLGYIGNISFGHAAFFGLGAYTAGLLNVYLGVPFWWGALLAVVPGILLGALVGFASIRVSGAYFAIATLTVAEFLRLVALNWTDLTRGPLGVLVPKPRLPMLDAAGLEFQRYYLLICTLALLGALLLLRRLIASPYGRAWSAIREAPDLAESVGIDTLRYRVVNISIDGGMAGLAGALLVPKILVLTPELFSPAMSATALLVAILGGKGTLLGALIGGMIFSALPEALRFIDQYRFAVFAALLLVVIRLQPGGIMSLVERFRRPASIGSTVTPTVVPKVMPLPLAMSFEPQQGATLEVSGVGRSFGGLRAVDDVSFVVHPGDLVGLIGPNGAGKTTCLTLLSGFVAPDKGNVLLDGDVITAQKPHVVARKGLVRTFQQALVCGPLSVFENALIGTHLHSTESLLSCAWQSGAYRHRELERAVVARRSLELVGLADRAHIRAADLPYGEQKMLSIAIALAAHPRMLLLDEPAAGLNHTEARHLAEVLQKLRQRGMTLVVVDHNLRMMMSLCDRMVVMHAGKKLAEGVPSAIRANPEVIRAYLGEHGRNAEARHA